MYIVVYYGVIQFQLVITQHGQFVPYTHGLFAIQITI